MLLYYAPPTGEMAANDGYTRADIARKSDAAKFGVPTGKQRVFYEVIDFVPVPTCQKCMSFLLRLG